MNLIKYIHKCKRNKIIKKILRTSEIKLLIKNRDFFKCQNLGNSTFLNNLWIKGKKKTQKKYLKYFELKKNDGII